MTAFRQIGEIHVLERVTNARHWRRRLAWSAKCDRESKGRHKNCNNNKDGDEKTLHAISLTRTSSATAGESELYFHFNLHNSSFSLSVQRPVVGWSAWLGQSACKLPRTETECFCFVA